jgi:hypothetical protein
VAPGEQVEAARGKWLPKVALTLLLAGFLVVAVAATGLLVGRGASPASRSFTNVLPAAGPTSTTAAAAYDAFGYAAESEESGAGGTANAPGAMSQSGQEGQNWDRMIIRTASLQLRVKDVSASMDEVRAVVGGHAGYVTASESRQEGDYTVGTMTVQVPAARFDGAMSQLRRLGLKVLHENVTSSDVTEEYTDLNSQLRNLQATEARILTLMGRAEQIGDILNLDRELRGIQGEIERIQGRVNFLGKRAEMSTITISLYPEAVAVEPATGPVEAWDPVRTASEAWEASLQLLANAGTLVITVVVYLWWLLPLLLVAGFFLRRSRRPLPAAPTAAAE